MAKATIAEVRVLGGLPDATKLPDAKITPHLNRAARELARWIGDYSDATGNKLEDCKEAEGCLTMYYLLPVLNTFFTSGISTLQKELGEIEFLFHGPEGVEKVRDMWWARADDTIESYRAGSDDAGSGKIRFYAV